jgi:predicted alpha/beta-hydrolase family hydrolase
VKISTAAGPASAELDAATDPPFLLVLTHGAGAGTSSADLLAARQAGLDQGAAVARVVQPYRLRGARAPGSAGRQDAAWLEIIAKLRRRFPGVPLVQGGRSNGARVACRTAQEAGALAVLALAFPLHPPGRPERSRAGELAAAGTEVLVVNGSADPFGVPEPAGAVRVAVLPGAAHALAGQGGAIRRVVGSWFAEVLARGSAAPPPGASPRTPRPGAPVAYRPVPPSPGRGRLPEGGRPVRLDDLAAGKQLAGVFEDHDAVAEQRPALLRVTGNGAGRLTVGGVRVRALWRMRAHGCPLVRCALVAVCLSLAVWPEQQ